MPTRSPRIENRKARHEYHIIEKYEAGLCLEGNEVKSIRDGGCSLVGSYVSFPNGEAFVYGAHIKPYENGDGRDDPVRARKLLLHRSQINKLMGAVTQRGMTVVPLALYFTKRGVAKLEIGLARGKQQHDKRATIKERDDERDRRREAKEY